MFRYTLLLCIAVASSGFAQEQKTYDCTMTEANRQFDFWIGHWQVTDKAGETTYGHNTISSREKGCLLLEEWRSARGSSGTSMNYYDPSNGQWHQHWVDSGSTIIHTAGGMKDGSMVMEGTIYYLAQEQKAPFRGTWTPMEDGRVRQFFEQQDDQGQWQPWFEGFYSRSSE